MEFLKEIIHQISDRRLKKIEIFNEDKRGKTSNYYKLYRGIRNGKIHSDQQAAEMILKTASSDKKYLMLKSRLRNRLLNTLFFLDIRSSHYSEIMVSYYRCNRDYLGAKILLTVGARKSAIQILKRTYRKAIENQFSELSLLCARYLRNHFAMMGNFNQFQKYNDALLEHQEILNAEIKVEGVYQEITIAYERTAAKKPKDVEKIIAYLDKISGIAEKYNNFKIKLYWIRLKIILDQLQNDYHKMIEHCFDLERHLNDHIRLVKRARFTELSLLKMVAFMHLGDYSSGKSIAEEELHFFKESSNNWMIFHEYYFLLCMNTINVSEAFRIYKRVTSTNRFENLPDARKEKWRIYQAYLLYCMRNIDDLQIAMAEEKVSEMEDQFRLYKFLNEVPIYSKDKKGFNIAILIIQVLFLIQMKRFGEVIDRMDAIRVYRSRYLRDDALLRTQSFIKLLQYFVKSDFKPDESSAMAKQHLNYLAASTWEYSDTNEDIEIIPYEKLWLMLLNSIDSQTASSEPFTG